MSAGDPVNPMTFAERALAFGRDVYSGHGKIEIMPKVSVSSLAEMAVAYTPGVGHVVRHVIAHPEALGEQTARDNMIALVTDGTAVLGLGDVGPRAAIPVMEGKAVMFKALAGIDCVPLCLDARAPDRFCEVVRALEPSFAGINLEDVAAPACFEAVRRLEDSMDVPILHDDQYGTATVVTAAMINALAATGRKVEDCRVVVNGIGAAGTATIHMLTALGVGDIIAVDRYGILDVDDVRAYPHWREIAARTNSAGRRGNLAEAMRGADAFVGLSTRGLVNRAMVRSMAKDPIVFALANPEPEIEPEEAEAAGATLVATGRFDGLNHCNNVLAFPGLMRGAMETRASRISLDMCLAGARAIASHPRLEHALLPSPLDLTLHAGVAEAVGREAIRLDIARRFPEVGEIAEKTLLLAKLVNSRA